MYNLKHNYKLEHRITFTNVYNENGRYFKNTYNKIRNLKHF